jgi:DNA-binding IclR family transcriptional regulator
MDIVRRYGRPQSSTSDLLTIMVGLGLLYKDRPTRAYCLTPRAALLGGAVQPSVVRDGQLVALINRLSAQTGLAVGVFGVVGLNLQICCWRSGMSKRPASKTARLSGGQQDTLADSAAGWLLLSTIAQPTRDGMIRRMNAEAAPDRRFFVPDMMARVRQCRDQGHATGVAGFGSTARVTSILLPGLPDHQPLAIGLVYEPSDQIDPAQLLRTLQDAVAGIDEQETASAGVQPLFNAA